MCKFKNAPIENSRGILVDNGVEIPNSNIQGANKFKASNLKRLDRTPLKASLEVSDFDIRNCLVFQY
jgi:hypothetical protein